MCEHSNTDGTFPIKTKDPGTSDDLTSMLTEVFHNADDNWTSIKVLRCLNSKTSAINFIYLCEINKLRFVLKICTSDRIDHVVEHVYAEKCYECHNKLFLKVYTTFRYRWKKALQKLAMLGCTPSRLEDGDDLDTQDNIGMCIAYEYISSPTLERWAKREHTIEDWNSVIIQVFSALHLLQKKFQSFRHNDLLPHNIFIVNSPLYVRFGDVKFECKLNVKVWDFECAHSHRPGFINPSATKNLYHNCYLVTNDSIPQLDAHLFMNVLLSGAHQYELPQKIRNCFKKILTSKDNIVYAGRSNPLLHMHEYRIQETERYADLKWDSPKMLLNLFINSMSQS